MLSAVSWVWQFLGQTREHALQPMQEPGCSTAMILRFELAIEIVFVVLRHDAKTFGPRRRRHRASSRLADRP